MFSGKIVYSRESVLHIYHLDTQSTVRYDLTPLMRYPTWRADGEQIAYGVDAIYLLDLKANSIELLEDAETHPTHPAWDPTGTLLVYTVEGQTLSHELCFYAMADKQKRILQLPLPAFQADWHPAGNILAFVGIDGDEKHIFSVSLPALNALGEALANVPKRLTYQGRFNHAPVWSPDGRLIVYEAFDESTESWAIMLLDVTTGQEQRLTAPTINAHHPTWSHDGEWVAFELEQETLRSAIAAVNLATKEMTIICAEGGAEPDWYGTN